MAYITHNQRKKKVLNYSSHPHKHTQHNSNSVYTSVLNFNLMCTYMCMYHTLHYDMIHVTVHQLLSFYCRFDLVVADSHGNNFI